MDLYHQKSTSYPQKLVIHLIEIGFLMASYSILFGSMGHWLSGVFNFQIATGFPARRWIIFTFNIITFLRIAYTMFFLIKRRIPWEESIGVPMAFAVYYIGFAILSLSTASPINGFTYCGIVLFLTGCILNSGGEFLRAQWKKKPENQGKIYTRGFFGLSRHINYFGDILWVAGYALVTGNPYSAFIPFLLFCFFAFYNAPKLDHYLAEKYGQGYTEYAQNTRMLIPFVY
ncbi:MAG: DUF1295 domain-containing protein [Saprospiraceae bacterium]|nr:DUF1295 domain-containing protein [Saprospiraceae bacterium]